MVRYARAKGSKGANERLPEEATPWYEMKQQMINPKQKDQVPVKEILAKCMEDNSVTGTSWAQFEVTEPKKNAKIKGPLVGEDNESGKQYEESKKKKQKQGEETGKKSCKTMKLKKKKLQNLGYVGDEQKEKPVNNSKSETDFKSRDGSFSKWSSRKFENYKWGLVPTRNQKLKAGQPYSRRKPEDQMIDEMIYVEGRAVEIRRFHGYPVKKEDWIRLCDLHKKLKEENVPEDQLQAVMKLERRRAEKALARERKKVCFLCRNPGHMLSECPAIADNQLASTSDIPDAPITGMCFKCGSSEHTHFQCKVVKQDEYRFAKCFVCGEQGHISRQCSDNPRGLYPKGGGCGECGDVTHFRRNCPKYQKKQKETEFTVSTRNEDDDLEALDVDNNMPPMKKTKISSKKVVKF